MSYANQSQVNVTAALHYQQLLGIVLFSVVTTLPCCVFLFINGTMLFILKSKSVFCVTPRYILLYNLLFADTILLVQSQLLYLIAACRITLTYPACGFLTMLAELTNQISPLTLVGMSLERYVAVSYPLRHATIVTIRNTGVAIIAVWIFSSLNVLLRVIFLLLFPFADLESLQMTDLCSNHAMSLGAMSDYYTGYTCFVFISAGVAITYSYIGVMIAARSAATDKASAQKARNTLLLHLVQLGLSLSSTIYNPLLIAVSQIVSRTVILRIHNVIYVCMILFPRCLSALIYGIRDQTIRPVLTYHFCCQLKSSVWPLAQ